MSYQQGSEVSLGYKMHTILLMRQWQRVEIKNSSSLLYVQPRLADVQARLRGEPRPIWGADDGG